MSTFIKSIVVAAALFAGASSITAASAQSGFGLNPACNGSTFTPHGIWDCR